MKKSDQYKVTYRSAVSGRAVTIYFKRFTAAMGRVLALAFDEKAKGVRLSQGDCFVDVALMRKALQGRPLSAPAFSGRDLDFTSSWFNVAEMDYVPAVYDVDTGNVHFYHSPEECIVAACRMIFLDEDDKSGLMLIG